MKFIKPFVEASWLETLSLFARSPSMAFANCLPSSTPHWSNELTSQMMPCVKILCSYIAIIAPRVNGVTFFTTIEFVGRFPEKTLWGTRFSSFSPFMPAFSSSPLTCCSVLPHMRASVCAKKLARINLWWIPPSIGLWLWAGAMKSHGINRVPYKCNIYKISSDYLILN